MEHGERRFYRSSNVLTEREPTRIDWQLLPETERGVRVAEDGSCQEEHNVVPLANRTVRLRFRLENGKLYSFWVSRDDTGRSDGYVSGGGPGFTSDVDTVGRAALAAEAELQQRSGK